jgi:hypothetical protein
VEGPFESTLWLFWTAIFLGKDTETRKLHISSNKVIEVEKGHFPAINESFENKIA